MACVIAGCSNDRRTLPAGSQVTFHRFHDEPIKFRKYLARDKGPIRFRNIIVCSDHFAKEDFEGGSPRRLKPNAMPRYFHNPGKKQQQGFQANIQENFKNVTHPQSNAQIVASPVGVSLLRARLQTNDFTPTPTAASSSILTEERLLVNSILKNARANDRLKLLKEKTKSKEKKLESLQWEEERLLAQIEKGKATVEVLLQMVKEDLSDKELMESILKDIVPEYATGFKYTDSESEISDED